LSFAVGAAAVIGVIAATRGRLVGYIPGVNYNGGLGVGSIPSDAADSELVAASYELLGYIRDSDWRALAAIAHPELGVKFSPYATISAQSAKQFTPQAISAFDKDKTTYVWGVYDGSAEPIEMTPAEYFARFVFDRDYTRAPVLGINRVVRSGNALENIAEACPGIRFVDFHLPSPEGEDGAWRSLRLGFEEYRGSLMLTLILHSERTA
jgi:hypothetical protein